MLENSDDISMQKMKTVGSMKKSNIKSPTLRHPIKLELRLIYLGGPQISSENGKSANLWTYKISYISGPSATGAICRFSDLRTQYFGDLRICDFSQILYCSPYLNVK